MSDFHRGDRVEIVQSGRLGTVQYTYEDGATLGVKFDNHEHTVVYPSYALMSAR